MDIFLDYLTFLLLLFPVPYIFYKKGGNKFMFISSVFGAIMITELLLFIAYIPFLMMSLYITPQLRDLGYESNIQFLTSFMNFIFHYGLNLSCALPVLLSFLIYKKYEFFNKHT